MSNILCYFWFSLMLALSSYQMILSRQTCCLHRMLQLICTVEKEEFDECSLLHLPDFQNYVCVHYIKQLHSTLFSKLWIEKDDQVSFSMTFFRKRKLSETDEEVTEMFCPFVRGHYLEHSQIPKNQLLCWTRLKGLDQPKYSTKQVDKAFKSTVEVNGQM